MIGQLAGAFLILKAFGYYYLNTITSDKMIYVLGLIALGAFLVFSPYLFKALKGK